jgi:hypothetical protein
MSRARENADGARLDAPLASPAFTGTPTGITAAHLEAGVLPSGVTGGSGLTALGTVATGNLSNADIIFPAGHVLQVVSDNYNSQTEASSQIKVCDVELTAKQANSKFYYNFCTLLGGYNDPDNVDIRMTKTAGSTPINTDYLPADNRGPGTAGQTSGLTIYCDVQVMSAYSAHVGYVVSTWGAADLILSTHAKDDVLSFAVWISGGCYINRSLNRANAETGITSLTIFEIGV